MTESKEIIDSLKKKIRSVISMNEGVKERVVFLESELDLSKGKIKEQENRISELSNENNQNNLAEAFLKNNGNPLEAKLKINNIVREIDKCIALLNR